MQRNNVPPWLRHIWTELTKPPAVLQGEHRPAKVVRSDSQEDPDEQEAEEESEPRMRSRSKLSRWTLPSPSDSPTDPIDPKTLSGSSRTAVRVGQKYFTPRRVSRPASKPRPQRPKPTRAKPPARAAISPLTDTAGRAEPSLATARPAKTIQAAPAALALDRRTVNIVTAFGTKIVAAEPREGVWRLIAADGKAIALKPTVLPRDRIRFIADALDELAARGFTSGTRLLRTPDKRPFVEEGGQTYYASEWIEGRRVEFASARQVGAAAKSLARLHDLSRDYTAYGYIPPDAFGLFDRFLARRQQLSSLLTTFAQSDEDDFAVLAASVLTQAEQQASDTLALLKRPSVEEHLQISRQKPGLCHLDVTRGNLVFRPNGAVGIIDFDHMAFGPRVLDLGHLIRRAMQASGAWTSEVALAPLIAYNRVRPLDSGEYALLEAVLTFPHRLWRLCADHAQRPPTSPEGKRIELARLRDALQLEGERAAFLQTFARQVTRRA